MAPKHNRAGLVVQRKKFPPGGIGAKNIALYNKIATFAQTPSFTPYNPYNSPFTPFWRTDNILFDLESFSKPSLNIPVKYQYLLRVAATRWHNYIRFSDEVVGIIRKRVGTWNGIYIHEYREATATDENYMYGEVVSVPLNPPSELFYKFSLTINTVYVPKSSDQLLDMFTRMLGNAMGFNPSSSSRYYANWLYSGSSSSSPISYYKRIAVPANDGAINTYGGAVRGFTRKYFPTLMNAYEKYNGTVDGRPPNETVTGYVADGIPMGRSKHSFDSYIQFPTPFQFSNNNEFSTNLVTYVPPRQVGDRSAVSGIPEYIKIGIVNEIMSVDFHNIKGYISDLSLGFFADLHSTIDNKKVYTYRKKGSNEINSVIHLLSGGRLGITFNPVNGEPVENDDPPDVDGNL
jgi:hypothetical protein